MPAVSRKEFVDAELESLGGDIAAMENKYGISMESISSWVCQKSQPMLEHMINTSRGMKNENDRNAYRDHIGSVKRGIDSLNLIWLAYKPERLPNGGPAR